MKRNSEEKVGFTKIPATRIIALILMDVMSVIIASFGALFIRYDLSFEQLDLRFLRTYEKIFIPVILMTLLLYLGWHLYTSVWRYASANEFVNIIFATTCSAVVQLLFCVITKNYMPKSYYVFYWFFLTALTGGVRFGYRFLRVVANKRMAIFNKKTGMNVMIIGAGAAGNMILREIEASAYLNLSAKCVIDDHKGCHGKRLRGVPIVGGRDKILESAEHYGIDEIIFAIPSADAQTKKEILEICKETGCKLLTLPGMYQLIKCEVSVSKLREVEIEDLLGRDPIEINTQEVLDYVSGKVILVTGGGGSIGSEICRQIASHNPKQLIIVDIYENNAYDIQQELLRKYPKLNLSVLIASVRNDLRMNRIFETYKPDIVYHAAAHKHVPLMEENPNEAIKNNVMGTYKTAKAAAENGVKKFVLISTDKAVNPTNVMGASKRICEMVVQYMNEKYDTNFVSVRFGNVLGSNGSVIPLFKKQIEEGGPVTVTHPDIIRYFMTIPEAVSLVLQAGTYAKGGEIFVLDMGKPVKIVDLATNLIKLSGYRPGEDIEIKFTGLRPGEKMFEELLMNEEGLTKTANKMIFIGKQTEIDTDKFEDKVKALIDNANNETNDIRSLIKDLVPTYKPEGDN